MPRIRYAEEKKFKPETLRIMRKADQIATDYQRRGFNLSLRQLYYQFIAIDFFPNTEQSYNKLGRVVTDARMHGIMDWNHIEDRGRAAFGVGWQGFLPDEKSEIIRDSQYQYSIDLWEGQERRVEVWVEKQALEEVAQRAANSVRTGYFACKGYVSQSEMWGAGMRMRRSIRHGQEPLILHLGDHDPSGLDMTRDIQERLSTFAGFEVEVQRIALNMDQIEEFGPPPNPAKETDSRFAEYQETYGTSSSWELDSVSPELLVELITKELQAELNVPLFNARMATEEAEREIFERFGDRYEELVRYMEQNEEGTY